MRISDSPFLRGLAATDRSQIVRDVVREQGQVIDQLVDNVFRESAAAVEEAVRPLTYWTNLVGENRRNPNTSPLEFWGNLERQRRSNAEIDRQEAAATLFGTRRSFEPTTGLRPGLGTGLSPVEFAKGERSKSLPGVPTLATLPPPPPIRTIRYEDVVRPGGQVTGLIGRIFDVYA